MTAPLLLLLTRRVCVLGVPDARRRVDGDPCVAAHLVMMLNPPRIPHKVSSNNAMSVSHPVFVLVPTPK